MSHYNLKTFTIAAIMALYGIAMLIHHDWSGWAMLLFAVLLAIPQVKRRDDTGMKFIASTKS